MIKRSPWVLSPLGKSLSPAMMWIDRLAMWFLCVYTAENCIGCSGNWLMFGSVSIRIVLFVVCFLLTLPMVLRRFTELIRQAYVWLLAVFFVWLAISAFIGYHNGNSFTFIKADFTSLLSLALVPGFLVTVRTTKRLHTVLAVVFYSATVLAAVTIVFHFLLAVLPQASIQTINDVLNAHSLGGFAEMKTGVQRVYLRSQIFIQVAMLLGIWKMASRPTMALSHKLILWIGEAMLLFACVLTYTRGFWMALLLSGGLMVVLFWREWKRWLCDIGIWLLTLAIFLGLSWAAYGAPMAAASILERISPSLVTMSFLGDDADEAKQNAEESAIKFDEADELRTETEEQQKVYIESNPIIGHGLGKNLDGVRGDGKTEYMYQDMWMKTGMVGLLLFCMVIFWHTGLFAAHTLHRKHWLKNFYAPNSIGGLATVLVCCLLGVALTSYFNPFLTSPMGILVLMITAVGVNLALQQSPEQSGEPMVIKETEASV